MTFTLARGALATLSAATLALACAHAPGPARTAASPSHGPVRPTDLVVVLHPSGELVLEWRDNSLDETGFMLVEDCDGGGGGVLGIVGSGQTRAAVRGLEAGRTCSYAVFAMNEAGLSRSSNLATVTNAVRSAGTVEVPADRS